MKTTIFTKEELKRIRENNQYGHKTLMVDLHEMTRVNAMRLLKNIIALNFREAFVMKVIHGYHHGTALKEMVRNEHISDRVSSIEGCPRNEGMTKLQVCAGV